MVQTRDIQPPVSRAYTQVRYNCAVVRDEVEHTGAEGADDEQLATTQRPVPTGQDRSYSRNEHLTRVV